MAENGFAAGPAAARQADLTYVSDADPGLRRKRSGKGFRYLAPDGRTVADRSILARIRALAIPPAWTDVWICPSGSGHIQATGRDARGRKQYRYHPDWTACRDDAKFGSLVDFASALPKLRARIETDLSRRDLSRGCIVASIAWLMDNAMLRVGNEIYARSNRSFGATTLHSRHVAIEGSRIRFAFTGKSGKQWQLGLADRRIAAVIRRVQELPGQRLFQYIDEDGARREIHSQDVNAYIREAIGDRFSSRHFRTWGATNAAAMLFAHAALPETKRQAAQAANAVIDQVAARLNNTRAVCRRSYIHPAVIEAWTEGRFGDDLAAMRRRCPRPLKGLSAGESTLLRWLREKTP